LVARTLITTADERTWPKDKNEPVLFLGEWCKRYSRKHIWQVMDYEVATYHWDDRNQLKENSFYLQEVYEVILRELSEYLNIIHGTKHNLRYWRIIIGPWLSIFIPILFDRWVMLDKAINENEIKTCHILVNKNKTTYAEDYSQAVKFFAEDKWNEEVYSQLLNIFFSKNISIERVLIKFSTKKDNIGIPTKNIKKEIINIIGKFNKLFPRDDEYFFKSTYLYLLTDLQLQLKLKQIPRIWKSIPTPTAKPNEKIRQWRWESKNTIDFFTIVRRLIPLHIPMAYLEGYKGMIECANSSPWPQQPKAIFTSNDHLSNDMFKIWAAKKIEKGVPLVIGQHGGHYGMTPYSFHENHEITIADKWLSWGWSDENNNQIQPVGNLIALGHSVQHDPKGQALMVEMSIPRYSYHMYAAPIAGQWLSYFEDQCSFINALPKELSMQLRVRLHQNDYGWDQKERWNDRLPDLQFDSGQESIVSLIKKSRLYISTYNATTYLESLVWNVPTIIFWNPSHWELNKDADCYIGLLKSVGIFHDTPEGAAKQMIKVWEDIPTWWGSKEVQNARQKFCQYYSSSPERPLEKLRSIFSQIESTQILVKKSSCE
jgi:putative transferase (TIGR04331 family)